MAVFVSDSFTEASDVNLIDHTPTLGGPYVEHPHVNYSGVSLKLVAATDRIYGIGTDLLYLTATPPSADYYVQGVFFHASTIATNIAICARTHETDDTMYLARLDSGATWHVRKIVATVATTLGTSTNQIPSVGNSKTGKLVVQGDQISFYVEGVLEIGPITDTAITATGKVAVRNAGVASASTGMHLDSIEAGDLVTVTTDPSFRVNNLRPAIFKPGRAR